MQQQQQEKGIDNRRMFRLFMIVVAAHSASIKMFIRRGFGSRYLAWHGFAAIIAIMIGVGFGKMEAMVDYFYAFLFAIAMQMLFTAKQRWKGVMIHSLYDGEPRMIWFVKESTAKAFVEPLLCAVVGTALYVIGNQCESQWCMEVGGWVFLGVFTLAIDYGVYAAIQQRRVQAMYDARVENQLVREKYEEEYPS